MNTSTIIRERRKMLRLTQKELGDKINKSSQVISNLERGYSVYLLPEELSLLAKALGISCDELLGVTKQPTLPKRDLLDELFADDETFLKKIKSVEIDGTIHDNDGVYQLSDEQKSFLRSSIKMALEAAKRTGSTTVEIQNRSLIENEGNPSNQTTTPIVDNYHKN